MGNKKYVAYVGTYTHGNSKGIQVYDVDVENGKLIERGEVKVSNASHTAVSKNGKFLYSIEDEGVAVFQRDDHGDLTRINSVGIDGMRGCFLATDVDGRYLYVAGYHDGKVTVVHTHKDGSLGRIMDGVFHKGLGSVAERNFRPHVTVYDRHRTISISARLTMELIRLKSIVSIRDVINLNWLTFFVVRERVDRESSVSVQTANMHTFCLN